MSNTLMMYITVFVGSLFGITLLPEFASQCAIAANDTNVTGVTQLLVGTILPILWGAMCVGGIAGSLYQFFR